MEALIASYGSDSDSDSPPPSQSAPPPPPAFAPVPPPPSALLDLPTPTTPPLQPTTRIRTFPHITGNYALHVYIPIFLSPQTRKHLLPFITKLESSLPNTLNTIDLDIPLNTLTNDTNRLEELALGREFHVSLGRTVPIRVHQIDSVVAMLRQKLRVYKGFWIDFSKWCVFVNDDGTRSFVSVEVVDNGLREIVRLIEGVNEVYRLHSLSEFYGNPRPHISVAWALGDVREKLERVVDEVKRISGGKFGFSVRFGGVVCKIGKKSYDISKVSDKC